jgi:hypothetical protein
MTKIETFDCAAQILGRLVGSGRCCIKRLVLFWARVLDHIDETPANLTTPFYSLLSSYTDMPSRLVVRGSEATTFQLRP